MPPRAVRSAAACTESTLSTLTPRERRSSASALEPATEVSVGSKGRDGPWDGVIRTPTTAARMRTAPSSTIMRPAVQMERAVGEVGSDPPGAVPACGPPGATV